MHLKIGDKDYVFKFGIGFIRELDKVKGADLNGAKFGFGLEIACSELVSFNVATLSTILYCACVGKVLSLVELDNFVEDCEDIENLFNMVFSELEQSNAGKLAIRKLKAQMQ